MMSQTLFNIVLILKTYGQTCCTRTKVKVSASLYVSKGNILPNYIEEKIITYSNNLGHRITLNVFRLEKLSSNIVLRDIRTGAKTNDINIKHNNRKLTTQHGH